MRGRGIEDDARLLAQETSATVLLGEHERAQTMAQGLVYRAVPA